MFCIHVVCGMFIEIMISRLGEVSKIIWWYKTTKRGITNLEPHLFAPCIGTEGTRLTRMAESPDDEEQGDAGDGVANC